MNLTINIDIDGITKSILALKNEFEEDVYNRYGESPEWDNDTFTKEEYEANVDEFLNDFNKSVENLSSIIDNFPKKKNGTFNRKNIMILAECKNCVAIHEWHNIWIYYVVKVTAIDDHTLYVSLYKKVDTPA